MNSLYMDVHIPAAVTEGLRRRALDILTAQEDGARKFDDEDLLARATELGRVLLTQDDDLLRIAARWQQKDQHFAGLVYAHQLGPGIGQLIDDLELLARCAQDDELASRVIYLPLR